MDTTSDETSACAACDEAHPDPHACSSAGDAGERSEPRIAIPAELWRTGLLKPAWTPSSAEGAAGTTSLFEPGPRTAELAVPVDVPVHVPVDAELGEPVAEQAETVPETAAESLDGSVDDVDATVEVDGVAGDEAAEEPTDELGSASADEVETAEVPDVEDEATENLDEPVDDLGADDLGAADLVVDAHVDEPADEVTDEVTDDAEAPLYVDTPDSTASDVALDPEDEDEDEDADADADADAVTFVVPPVITPAPHTPTALTSEAGPTHDPEEATASADAALADDSDDAGDLDAPESEEPTPVDDQTPPVGDDTGTDPFRVDPTDDPTFSDEPTTTYDPFGSFDTFEPADPGETTETYDALEPDWDEPVPERPALRVVEDGSSVYDLGDSLYAAPSVADDSYDDAYGDPAGANLRGEALSSLALPSSVPFAPTPRQPRVTSEVPLPDEVVEEEKRPRRGLWAVAVVLVLAVAGGGFLFWQHQKDAPVREAFGDSNEAFLSSSAKLEAAGSIEQVALAGKEFARAADLLTATNDATRERSSDVAVAARRAALAQAAVADAAAPLKDLSTENLAPWSTAREALATALEGLPEVTDDIDAAGGSTSGLPGADVVEHVQTVIGDEVVSSAGAQVVEQLQLLQAANLLADVRAVGAGAGEYVDPLNDAAEGLGDETKAASLQAYRNFYEALAGLQGVRPKNLEAWPKTREEIEDAARDLPEADRTAATEALADTNKLVEKAQKKYEAWQTKHAAAKAKRSQDLADVEAAVKAVDGADASLATLRTQLQDFAKGAGSLPAEGRDGEAFRTLDAAAKAREDLLTTLTGLSVPKRAQGELDALVEVVTADAETVRAAADAAAGCEKKCTLTSQPTWRPMLEQNSDGATAWTEAYEAWKPVSEDAKERVAKRKLPKRPTI